VLEMRAAHGDSRDSAQAVSINSRNRSSSNTSTSLIADAVAWRAHHARRAAEVGKIDGRA